MIHFILGTRAQLTKLSPVMKAYQKRGTKYNFIFLAQHHKTIYDTIEKLELRRPDFVIGDTGKDQTKALSLFIWAIKTLLDLIINRKKYFLNDKEGIVIVQGDALPVFLGALAAKFCRYKVVLIESGMRSFNWLHPFPEEITRVTTWALGLVDYHFCENSDALSNVKKFKGKKFNTQINTAFDALHLALKYRSKSTIEIPKGKYALAFTHRFEQIHSKERMKELVAILNDISKRMPLILSLHPPTKIALEKFDLLRVLERNKRIEMISRLKFLDYAKALVNSEFVFTDSGGIPEECYYLGKPCIVYRKVMERSEGIGESTVLSKFSKKKILDFVDNYKKYRRKPIPKSLSPTKKIIEIIDKMDKSY